MSFPPYKSIGGSGMTPGSRDYLSMGLSADVVMNVGEIAEVPFDVEFFARGGIHGTLEREFQMDITGLLLINASIGCAPTGEGFSLTILLYKNDLPFRQHASAGGAAPYVSAAVSLIDQCIPGDRYTIYSTATSDGPTYTLNATQGLCGVEIVAL